MIGVKWKKLVIPDLKAGEEREENSGDDGEWDGKHSCGDAIDPNPRHLEECIAPEPHPVSTAHWEWLCYHILKTYLSTHTEFTHKRE